MSTINRFSSRRQRLDHAFLSAKLSGAKSYKASVSIGVGPRQLIDIVNQS